MRAASPLLPSGPLFRSPPFRAWPVHDGVTNARPYLGNLLSLQPSQYSLSRILESIHVEGVVFVRTLAQDDLPIASQVSIDPASRYHLSFSSVGCSRPQNPPLIRVRLKTVLSQLFEEGYVSPDLFCFFRRGWNRER